MKSTLIHQLLKEQPSTPRKAQGVAFAPSNIALCKYWGKRCTELNLPITSSLSISLGNKGTSTEITLTEQAHQIKLNDQSLPQNSLVYQRVANFLNGFQPTPETFFSVTSFNNIPLAAGLASSASGFAALVLALADLFGWTLEASKLSVLARLGSGSASRSLWHGFVKWHAGSRDDGMDSFAEPLEHHWPELRVGLLILNREAKPIGSTEAMQRTVMTAPLYKAWPEQTTNDLNQIKQAIDTKDFVLLGTTAEHNALSMHALMWNTQPPIVYSQPETLAAMQTVWALRASGLPIYFTQDAGANLKLLFLKGMESHLRDNFPTLEIVAPFTN